MANNPYQASTAGYGMEGFAIDTTIDVAVRSSRRRRGRNGSSIRLPLGGGMGDLNPGQFGSFYPPNRAPRDTQPDAW